MGKFKITDTDIKEVKLIVPLVHEDQRGWFFESYSKGELLAEGINVHFVQDNHSYSSKAGTIRGIHFQNEPKAQTKLVRCTRGSVIDVAIDLRKYSPTYKMWVAQHLSADNKHQLLIPKGFGHAFLTLENDTEVEYKVDEYYSQEYDRSVKYDDPSLGIDIFEKCGIQISEKDQNAPLLADSDCNFVYKVLVTGSNGQLGNAVVNHFRAKGYQVFGAIKDDFDISDFRQTMDYIEKTQPNMIIHCAAYTAVDQAEIDKETCYATNVTGTRNVVNAAKAVNATVVFISTDYVFDGTKESPYTEKDQPNPINYYGYTKAEAEKIIQTNLKEYYIVRTAWLYGEGGDNFINKVIQLSKAQPELHVVDDQIGTPTYVEDLAEFITNLVQTERYGIYHGVNGGYCSRFDLAKAILQEVKSDTIVIPSKTMVGEGVAKRPLNSRLACENKIKSCGSPFKSWELALHNYIVNIGKDVLD